MRSLLIFVVLAALGAHPATAQVGVPLPDSIIWERVGYPEDIYNRRDFDGVGFCGDTLYATGSGIRVLRGGGPGYSASAGIWEEVNRSGSYDGGCIDVGGAPVLYIKRLRSLHRSRDGGYTIEEVLGGGRTMPVLTPDRGLVGWFEVVGYGVCQTADGEAWSCRDYVTGGFIFPRVFAAARPGGPISLNRLMANGQDGPAYSDGGDWLPSNLMVANDGAGAGLAVLDGGPLHGHALAVVQNESSRYRIYESTDGATWADVGPTPDANVPGIDVMYLVAIPGGFVAAYGSGTDVWLSGDAGRSWRMVFDVDGPLTSNDQVMDVELGPDGRLYAAVDSQQSQDAFERGGIYRTVEPLFVVAGEAAPETAPGGVGVSVRPNPASGRVEVLVSLVSAGSVRVAVFDAQGREVALAFDGAMPAGERVVGVETGAWPAGVYVVRVSAAGGGGSGAGAASARFTVAR